MKPWIKMTAGILAGTLVAIQFIPVHRVTIEGSGDPPGSRRVQWLLRRACYDCHSTESRWPIWAYVAPASWMVVRDVNRARRVLNLSDWPSYAPERQATLKVVMAALSASHRMPLWYYVTLHPDARLSAAEVTELQSWAKQ